MPHSSEPERVTSDMRPRAAKPVPTSYVGPMRLTEACTRSSTQRTLLEVPAFEALGVVVGIAAALSNEGLRLVAAAVAVAADGNSAAR